MAEPTAAKVVTIINPLGIHLRPADLFVKLACQFQSAVEIVKNSERFDGKSVLSMLTLAAVQGTELTIKVTGPDAEQTLSALVELVDQGFGEMESSGPQSVPDEKGSG